MNDLGKFLYNEILLDKLHGLISKWIDDYTSYKFIISEKKLHLLKIIYDEKTGFNPFPVFSFDISDKTGIEIINTAKKYIELMSFL